MRRSKVWGRLLGLDGGVLRGLDFDESAGAVVAQVRVSVRYRHRCGQCQRRCGRYDGGEGRRRWRGLDLGSVPVFLEADAPRVNCPQHGVVVAAVPWARHDSRFTKEFEAYAAWLAVHVSRTTLADLMRVAWRTVGGIVTRVVDAASAARDLLADAKRLGIDEVSFRRGHQYLLVVINHDTGRVIWVAEGHDEATLEKFFDALGPVRSRAVRFVSADAATWIRNVVRRRCPRATLCMDSFHVVAWATRALDDVRRLVWNAARRSGQGALARQLKGARFALWKSPPKLTARQHATISAIARTNKPLYRAYLLKEQLREVFRLPFGQARALLDSWLTWARRCRLKPFVAVAQAIARHRVAIDNTLRHGLTNARTESVNTRIRLLTRIAFGFHSARPLIAMVMLSLGGLCPDLPGRC